jgi:arylsulfatase A-like enzyme
VAPLRGGKQELYEGGIRVPLVVSWPARIEPNSISEVPVSSVDFFPTLVSLAGGEPAEQGDGVDLSGVLLERDELSRESLYFHMPHRSFTSAIRSGDLKLIHRFRGGDELYDLSADIGEENDLAKERPEDVARLRGELFSWLQTVEGGIPRRNPDQR